MKPFNILLLILMSTIFFSCEKEDPPKYDFPTVTVDGIIYGINIDNTTKITNAFALDCNNCSGDIHIQDSVRYKGKWFPVKYLCEKFLYGPAKVTSVSIPPTIIEIGENAFSYNGYLKEIIFKDSNQPINVTYGGQLCDECTIRKLYIGRQCSMEIGDYLETIHIGPTVKHFSWAFKFGYKNIKTIICDAEIPPKVDDNTSMYHALEQGSTTLIVPRKSLDTYKNTKPWALCKTIRTK